MIRNSLNKMFCKVKPGMCRLSMNGIAVKTSSGDYKTYDVATGQLVNCADFVFDVGDEWFFCIPTNQLFKGDIILVNNLPAAVIEVKDNLITAFRYEDSTIVTIVPEHFVFLGNTYFYSKIVSLFGNMTGGMDMNNIMSYMMMSEMMKGSSNGTSDNKMMPFMMMSMMSGHNPFANIMGAMNPNIQPVTTNPTMPATAAAPAIPTAPVVETPSMTSTNEKGE